METKQPLSKKRKGKPRRSRWLRRTGFVGLFLLGILGLVHVPLVRTALLRTIINNFNPFETANITIEDSYGFLGSKISLSGVSLTDGNQTLVAVSNLSASFSLIDLVFYNELSSIDIEGVTLSLQQNETGAWALPLMKSTDEESAPNDSTPDNRDSDSPGTPFVIRSAGIDDVSGRLLYWNPDRDSTWTIHSGTVLLKNFQLGSEISVDIDTLHLQFSPAASPDTVRVSASGELERNVLRGFYFSLDSDLSHIVASGSFPVVSNLENLSLSIDAPSLALRDINPFVGGLNIDTRLSLNAEITGSWNDLAVELEAHLAKRSSIFGSFSYVTSSDSVRVKAELTIDKLQPAELWSISTSPVETISARVDADLTGTALDQLNGHLRITAEHVAEGTPLFNTLLFEQIFTGGRGDFTLEGASEAGAVSLSGWIRPLDTDITWDADGTLEIVALSKTGLVGNFPVEFSGQVHSLRQTEDLIATTSLQIDRGQSGQCEIQNGSINLLINGAEWSSDAELFLCDDGAVTGRAGSIPDGNWTAESDFYDLSIMAILGDSTASSFSGNVSLSGKSPTNSAILAELFLDESEYGPYRIDSVRAFVTLDDELLAMNVTANLDSMIVAGNAELNTHRERFSLKLEDVSFYKLDVEQIIGPEALEKQFSTEFSGTGEFELLVDENGLISTNGAIILHPSTVNQMELSSGTVSWNSGANSINIDLIAQFEPSSRLPLVQPSIKITGHLTRDSNQLSVQDLEGVFEFIDVGQIAGIEGMSSSLSGMMTMHGDIDQGAAQLQIDPGSSMNKMDFDEFNLESSWDEKKLLIEGRIQGLDGSISANGALSRDPLTSSGITLESTNFDFSSLLGDLVAFGLGVEDSSATSSVSFTGSIGKNSLQNPPTWNVDIDSLTIKWLGLSVRSGEARLNISSSAVHIDTLHLAGGFGTISASGHIDKDSSRTAESSLAAKLRLLSSESLGPFSSIVPATWSYLESDLRIFKEQGLNRAEANIDVGNLQYEGARIAFAGSERRAELDADFNITAAELESSIEVISLGGVTAESMDVDVEYLQEKFALNVFMQVDDRRKILAELQIDAFSEDPVIQVDEFIAELDEEVWRLAAPARIVLDPVPDVRGLVLQSDAGRLAATTVGESGEKALLINLENFNLDSVTDIFDFEGLGGVIDGRMILTRPEETLDIEASISGTLSTHTVPAGSLAVQLKLESEHLQINMMIDHVSGRNLSARGEFDLRDEIVAEHALNKNIIEKNTAEYAAESDTSRREIEFTIAAENFPIDWALPFLDLSLIDHVSGLITTDLSIRGTWSEPNISGTFVMQDGSLGLTELGKRGRGLRYENIDTDLVFSSDSAFINSFTAHSGSGLIEISGEVALPTLTLGEFSLEVEAKNFLAVNNLIYRAVIDGSLQLSGTTVAPILSGDLRIPSATYFLTNESASGSFEPITLTDEDVLIVERSFGIVISEADTSTFDLYEAMKIENLTVEFDRDSWFRSRITPDMDIQFTGDLDISKEPDEEPIVFGTIEVLPERSQIVQFGRKFRITRGTISLNGPIDNPVLDLEATYIVPSRTSSENEVTIRLLVSGDMESLNLSFESDPAMELSDVISYIVTGRPAGENLSLSTGNDQYGGTAASLAVGPMTSLAESIAGESLGLDVVEITYDAVLGLKFTGGKYLSPKLYVAVSQPLTTASSIDKSVTGLERYTSITIEYEVIRRFLAALITRGPILNYSVRWRHDF